MTLEKLREEIDALYELATSDCMSADSFVARQTLGKTISRAWPTISAALKELEAPRGEWVEAAAADIVNPERWIMYPAKHEVAAIIRKHAPKGTTQ